MINLQGFCQSPILVNLSNSPGNVVPGGHFTLFFDVKSDSLLPKSFEDSISFPDQWNLLSQRKPERTAGQKEVRYFYVIGTSAVCTAGEFPVYFSLTFNGKRITTAALVTIQEVRKIDIFIVSQPEFVKEGDTLRVEYLVQNSGNKSEKLRLKTNRGSIENGADSILLEPNAKAKIAVSQMIPFTENNAWQGSSDLIVNMTGIAQSVYQVASIPVFSTRTKKIDRYFRFPVEVGAGYLLFQYGDKTRMAYQYSAAGNGFIDQKSRHFVDFVARGPNQFAFPAIGSYDQYSLEYQYRKKTFITVGDYILQLNNLIEFGRFGRGLKLEQQFGKFGASLFYQKARFYVNQKESVGGRISYKIGAASNISVSYASKDVVFRSERFWSNLLNVASLIRTKTVQIETELAAGKALGKTDYGVFSKIQLTKNRVTFTSNVIYAGKNFYGFYNNSLLINNNVGVNISRKLTVGLSGIYSNVNPSLDANLYSVSPKDRSYMAFMSYQSNLKNRFFVFYSTQEREDRQKPSTFHFSENFGNVSYNYNAEKFSMFYQGRYGYSRNRLVFDNTGKKQSFSNLVQPSVKLLSWLWIGAYLEHQHTSKFSTANVIENLFFYGGNARVNLKRNLYATFFYRNNYAPDELYVRRSYMDASVLLDLKRHKFSLSGGRSFVPNIQNTSQNTLFFTLRHAIKLNIPLSRKKNVGFLKGKLTGSGFQKAGNLIQLGSHKFLTDSTGNFFFEGIKPDQYYLSIKQNESGSEGVVPYVKMPLFIDVKADSIKNIEIPLTRTGSVVGKIEFVKPIQNGLSSILNNRPVVLVKLSNETSSLITELNDKDEFSFKEMKPGNWTLSAFIPGNQDRFVIEESQKQLNIEIDKTMKIVFKVRPNEKRIHFSEKSFDVSVKK